MKSSILKTCLLAATTLGCAAVPARSHAQTYSYYVNMDVATLLTDPTDGPYYLDFQLNGDGLPAAATNSVTVSGISFSAGGGPAGSPVTFENASGNLNSAVTLSRNASNTANEFYQVFSITTTDIEFLVTSTENGSGITPDLFAIAILDDNAMNNLSTDAPDSQSLLTESINGTVTPADVDTYESTSPEGVTATVVPEPTTVAYVFVGVGGLCMAFRRRK